MAFRELTQQANHVFLCNAKRDNTSYRSTLPRSPSGFPTKYRELRRT